VCISFDYAVCRSYEHMLMLYIRQVGCGCCYLLFSSLVLGVSILSAKWLGHDTNHSPPFSAEVKKNWQQTLTRELSLTVSYDAITSSFNFLIAGNVSNSEREITTNCHQSLHQRTAGSTKLIYASNSLYLQQF
jgi:hypothetical protein